MHMSDKNDKKDSCDINLTPIDSELDQQEDVESEQKISFGVQTRRDERVLAFNLIYAVDRFDYTELLETIVSNYEKGFDFVVDRDSYALKLAQGTIDQRDMLDELMTPFLKNWKLSRLGCSTRLILRMALWELIQSKAIASIIINEAVELAKIFAEKDAFKFINGILDHYCKEHNLFTEEDLALREARKEE